MNKICYVCSREINGGATKQKWSKIKEKYETIYFCSGECLEKYDYEKETEVSEKMPTLPE